MKEPNGPLPDKWKHLIYLLTDTSTPDHNQPPVRTRMQKATRYTRQPCNAPHTLHTQHTTHTSHPRSSSTPVVVKTRVARVLGIEPGIHRVRQRPNRPVLVQHGPRVAARQAPAAGKTSAENDVCYENGGRRWLSTFIHNLFVARL